MSAACQTRPLFTFGGAARAAGSVRLFGWPLVDTYSDCRGNPPQARGPRGRLCARHAWISDFWLWLADHALGIRLQVHTHPAEALHSSIDDEFPIIHTPGFLSLVIPEFALGPVGFQNAYITEIQLDGGSAQVPIEERLVVQ